MADDTTKDDPEWPRWMPTLDTIQHWAAGNESDAPFDADSVCALAQSWIVMAQAVDDGVVDGVIERDDPYFGVARAGLEPMLMGDGNNA